MNSKCRFLLLISVVLVHSAPFITAHVETDEPIDDINRNISTNSAVLRLENAIVKTSDDISDLYPISVDSNSEKYSFHKPGIASDLPDIIRLADEEGKLVMLHFHADWCYYCQKFKPIIDSLHKKVRGLMYFYRVDIVKNKELSKKYNIRKLPELIFLEQGKIIGRMGGISDAEKQMETILPYLVQSNPDVDIDQFIEIQTKQEAAAVAELEEMRSANESKFGVRKGTLVEYNSILQEAEIEGKPIIMDFYANWCAPCRQFSPIFDKLSKKYFGKVYFIKVNVDDDNEVSEIYGVSAIPTIIIINATGVLHRLQGVAKESSLSDMLDDAIQRSK